MELNITPTQLRAQPAILDILFAKMVERVQWKTSDLTKDQIQYCLDNDIHIDGAELYSPVMSDNRINTEVPDNWPGGDGLTYAEYLRPIDVQGGTVLQFVGGPMMPNRNITLPTFAQLKIQVAMASGFLTRSEVDAIRIITEEI